MIQKTFLKTLVKTHFFAKAIALDDNKELSRNFRAWCYYHLGMYRTVTQFDSTKLKKEGLVASIVSHASCGEFSKAKEIIELYLKEDTDAKYLVKLADALSPYMPKEAMVLLEKKKLKPQPLYAAILLKLQNYEEAHHQLKILVENKVYLKKPETLLYFSNSKKDMQTSQKIDYLNRYFHHFKLSEVRVIDEMKPLNVMNIRADYAKEYLSSSLVTIIMTAYNIGSRIGTAIASVLNQSYQNIEFIIVNDASEDNTIEVINNWVEKDDRVKVIDLKVNVGTYVAKNIALLKCKGEFVTCHDSDDWSHPLKIERQIIPLLKNKSVVATISNWIRLDDVGNYYARPVHPLSRMNPSSLLFRKDIVFENAGLWDCVRTGADSEFIARLKLVFGRMKIKRIKEPLSFGAHRDDSLMTAQDTGYCQAGMSPHRLAYWEFWGRWHIESLSQKKKPTLSLDLLSRRKFNAPENIIVPLEHIKENLVANGLVKHYTTSAQLITNTKDFLNIKKYTFFDKFFKNNPIFYGWGRKKSGLKAIDLAQKRDTSFVLLEDGFIRSLGLGVNGSPSFSIVEDDIGIYYDATMPSKLENILNSYDFENDAKLMSDTSKAIELIVKHHISKYNNAPDIDKSYFKTNEKRVLIIAQTAGDASLKYGMLDGFSTDEMIDRAIKENPQSKIYLKIHPDVISGKKKSDIDSQKAKEKCMIIEDDINPISLLKYFDKVYTKTSGMGFEALLVGCKCVCFGMPFYAGWGITEDKSQCVRRKRKLTIEEVFAGAYILYTRYYNPYKKRDCDIIEAIEEIVYQRKLANE